MIAGKNNLAEQQPEKLREMAVMMLMACDRPSIIRGVAARRAGLETA